MNQPDLLAATTPVVEALDALGVAYHIGGSVASSAQGLARTTLDVDLVADLRLEHVQPLVQRLIGSYYVDGEMIAEAIRRRACFNVIHLTTMLKVDVFVLKDRPYDRQAFGRRYADTLDDVAGARSFYLASAEDTVLNKLEWFKLGDEVSDRQWSDVQGVLRVQGRTLDLDYLRRWAVELDLSDLLQRALEEAEPE
jgi:hypothetical protein